MSAQALAYKEQGNRHFGKGEYAAAEGLYSSAILADPKNPALYTNRALARLKLEHWDGVVYDCRTCLDLAPDNMKAYYYLSQAELALRDYDAAVADCRRAQALCAKTHDKSIANITAHLLACKKARWDDRERRRLRALAPLEAELLTLLERERDASLQDLEGTARDEAAAEWAQKITDLEATFDAARARDDRRRSVPEWALDDISFEIMVDPVVTKTGKSYERASLLEHLRRSPTDPLTREPLTPADLRPNLGLRQACEEFLDQNGWAVEW